MNFPLQRPRRLRTTETMRNLVRENQITRSSLVQPLFIVAGKGIQTPIASLSGCSYWSADLVSQEARRLFAKGIPAVLLFGLPQSKDATGSSASDPDGEVQRAVANIKNACPDMLVITDVCLCEYTDHGHCGVLHGHEVDNDATLKILAQIAVSHARAGADIIAPSDMMDGRILSIRQALDGEGFSNRAILSYAVKYASSFYGPFREAANCAPQFGDRRAYQMDPANAREAIREALLDIEEGADMLMVKPAMPYLDVLARLREVVHVPLAAYQVSGEYAMIKAAAEKGLLDEKRAVLESLVGLKRAGADILISYFADAVADWL